MKNPKYYDSNLTRCAWSNLSFYGRDNAITVMDAIEDAVDGKDLVERLSKIDMVCNTWVVDRETNAKVRIKHVDGLGNAEYIECEK